MTKNTTSGKTLFTVVGADTYLGAHLLEHLEQTGNFVYGISQAEDFCLDYQDISTAEYHAATGLTEVNADWLIICVDPSIGYEQYVAKLKQISDVLIEKDFCGDICFISSASICLSEEHEALSEEVRLYPRTEIDLALTAGENLMNYIACNPNCYAIPHIMRIGIPYGSEIADCSLPDNFLSKMLAEVQQKDVVVPLTSDAKRTLTHISDICESIIAMMQLEDCPMTINIPGEVKTLKDVGVEISNKYHVGFHERGLSDSSDLYYFCENQHLSDKLFKETIKFTPKYSFSSWLKAL